MRKGIVGKIAIIAGVVGVAVAAFAVTGPSATTDETVAAAGLLAAPEAEGAAPGPTFRAEPLEPLGPSLDDGVAGEPGEENAALPLPAIDSRNYRDLTAEESKDTGLEAAEVKESGWEADELKEGGYEAAELKEAGFEAEELKEAGYEAAEMKEAGFEAEELKEAGYEAAESREAGFTAEDSKKLRDGILVNETAAMG